MTVDYRRPFDPEMRSIEAWGGSGFTTPQLDCMERLSLPRLGYPEYLPSVRDIHDVPTERMWLPRLRLHAGWVTWRQRELLYVLDRERSVARLATFPMWVLRPGVLCAEVFEPFVFVRRRDGTGLLLDVVDDDEVAGWAESERMATMCEIAGEGGWRYRLWIGSFSRAGVL